MTFECVVKKGHFGAGKNCEGKIYVSARNILEAMSAAKARGGVKKGINNKSGQAIISLRKISD